jgi:hypothetical protein
MIDVSIPADRNIAQNEAAYKLKYNRLCIEISGMGKIKCLIISVTIGTTGMVTKGVKKELVAISGIQSIDLLQKTAILGTTHILRKVLQCET